MGMTLLLAILTKNASFRSYSTFAYIPPTCTYPQFFNSFNSFLPGLAAVTEQGVWHMASNSSPSQLYCHAWVRGVATQPLLPSHSDKLNLVVQSMVCHKNTIPRAMLASYNRHPHQSAATPLFDNGCFVWV